MKFKEQIHIQAYQLNTGRLNRILYFVSVNGDRGANLLGQNLLVCDIQDRTVLEALVTVGENTLQHAVYDKYRFFVLFLFT